MRNNTASSRLSNIRICFIFVIAFAGLMRCDEIIHVARMHVFMYEDHITIFCPKKKNDQLARGHSCYLARSDKITCPVSITQKLLATLPANPDQFLVCRLSSCPLKPALSYTPVLELFRDTLKSMGIYPSPYGTHSLKKGGATACHTAGVDGGSLDQHVGWKSLKSKLHSPFRSG